MKKIISIIMVLAMIFAMSTTAFAAQLTINDNDDRTYAGYQLLNLTTSLKACTEHTDNNHDDDCYNYAYTVNKKYREILWAETFANGSNDIWGDKGKPADADSTGVTTAQKDAWIMAHLNKQSSDSNGAYGSMRDVADRLYRAIKDGKIAADKNNLTGNKDDIAQGYWIFADVTGFDPDDNYKANSLVMVDTAGQDPVVITPKTALPTIEKKVKDINNSTDGDITDNAWQDSADHDFGDTVPFKLTATLPSNVANYGTYKLAFQDRLSDGLELDENSFKVYMYNDADAAKTDVELKKPAKDVTESFELVKTANLADGCTFEVACENVLAIKGVTKDTVFVVYYEATLKTTATVGAAGNSNEARLEFSNDPYSDGTGKTEFDRVEVYTYKVVINKTDAEGNALKGAGFTLYKKGTDGKYAAIGNELKGADMTTFTWKGLDDGDYKLVETTVPDGYNKMPDTEFTVTARHDETTDVNDPDLISLSGDIGTGDIEAGTIEEDIVNYTGTVLPQTGAQGTFFLICGGSILVVLAAVFMITRKKMSVFEE